jgi:hypothetical protein
MRVATPMARPTWRSMLTTAEPVAKDRSGSDAALVAMNVGVSVRRRRRSSVFREALDRRSRGGSLPAWPTGDTGRVDGRAVGLDLGGWLRVAAHQTEGDEPIDRGSGLLRCALGRLFEVR